MDRSRRLTLPALIAVLALVLAACAAGTASPATAETDASEATPSHAEHTESAAPTEEPGESEEAAESEGATAEEVRVRLESSNFDPSELTIPAGTTVLFLNADSYAHTVTEGTGGQAVEDPIVDRELAQNRTVRVTFDEPGTYDITCEFHPSMQMTVTVEG